MVEYQYFVFNLSITGSKVRYGRQIFIRPSTSPIFTLIVIIAIISLGEIIWANCEFVSIRSSLGCKSTTFSHGSRSRSTQTPIILSIISNSISEKSRTFANGSPLPPSIRSTMVYARFEAISRITEPFNGEKLTIPRTTGLESAFENSE